MNEWRKARAKHQSQLVEFQNAMKCLRSKAQEEAAVQLVITENERGNWGHYYHCRHDGQALAFDWHQPQTHICPACRTVWTGEPFDSSWIGLAHSRRGHLTKHLAVRQFLEPSKESFVELQALFLDYAKYYSGFEIHGDIPYNGPGKLFAQTLDESHWIMNMAIAYTWIKEQFTDEERKRILDGLFRPCSQFLTTYKEKQVHNHAVLITSAISILGYILDDEQIIRAGLEGEFGLYDQISKGVLAEGFWYEGAFSYHYYAMEPIVQYALIVENSKWDIRKNDMINRALQKMFTFPLRFLLPTGKFPSLNDAGKDIGIESYAHLYEFAYDWYGDEIYQKLLAEVYSKGKPRDSLYVLVCGKPLDHLNKEQYSLVEELATNWHSAGESGITKLVNQHGYHITVKHSLFGGEHDHMDRLGVSYGRGNQPIFYDPGTVAYAVPVHYDWFKHTYSHNTVCLNGFDQPPADGCKIIAGEEYWGQWIASSVSWNAGDFKMKNSIILPEEMCPWDEPAYEGASFTRVIALTDHMLLDFIKVKAEAGTQADVLYHMSGETGNADDWEEADDQLSKLNQALFNRKRKLRSSDCNRLNWTLGELSIQQSFYGSDSCTIYTAETPDNPPDRNRQTLIQRFQIGMSGEAWAVNVFSNETSADWSMKVQQKDQISIEIAIQQKKLEERFLVSCSEGSAKLQYMKKSMFFTK